MRQNQKLFQWFMALASLILMSSVLFDQNQSCSGNWITCIFESFFDRSEFRGWLVRVLGLILLTAIIYNQYSNYRYRRNPITLITSSLVLELDEPSGGVATLTRVQRFRVNKPDVSAYYQNSTPSNPGAKIPRESIELSANSIGGTPLTFEKKVYGRSGNGVEVIQDFTIPLPYSWLLKHVPVWFLSIEGLRRVPYFKDLVLEREATAKYEGEYDCEEPYIELQAGMYAHSNVSVTIKMPDACAPNIDEFEAIRIQANGIRDIAKKSKLQGDIRVITISIPFLFEERARISWPNKYLAQAVFASDPSTEENVEGNKHKSS